MRQEIIWTGPELAAHARTQVGKKLVVNGRRGRVLEAGALTITIEIETPAEEKRRARRTRLALRWSSRLFYSFSIGWGIATHVSNAVTQGDFQWALIPMHFVVLASWAFCERTISKHDRNYGDHR